ncbi:hypothetical protein HPP92_012697 [Vanilla planifolia]|uniref:Uncharacterized protein n=1 Tax=Vanilla planifolia TaxID=51239 RepID=A0A835R0Y4_VANPL|nr:hypothetical protein HPP92_012697 [Vanilla planifolia]
MEALNAATVTSDRTDHSHWRRPMNFFPYLTAMMESTKVEKRRVNGSTRMFTKGHDPPKSKSTIYIYNGPPYPKRYAIA